MVVPTWNEERHLPRLLASLGLGADGARAGADRAPDEVVVADGGSDDATAALARACGARVVTSALGRGTQLAAGARAARGELLWFLHADMRVRPGSLEALLGAFEDARLVACGVHQTIDARGLVYRSLERVADLRVRLGRVYGDSALAVRRAEYEAAGGFRAVPLFEDLDLARRLRRRGRVRLVAGAAVHVSARRWRAEGVLRRTLANQVLTAAWALGVAPERLARYYRPASGHGAPPAPDDPS